MTTTAADRRFALELFAPSGRSLGGMPLTRADLDRAAEATFFAALREGKFVDYQPDLASARFESTTDGFQVVLPTPVDEQRCTFGLDYFQTLVRQKVAGYGVEGTLAYGLVEVTGEAVPAKKPRFMLDADEVNIPIREGKRSASEPWDSPDPRDMTVVLPRHVIEEGQAEAARTPDREVGGVLLGHLCRDRDTGELYLEVTCLVPAEETESTALSVTFTHATWARVREVVAWRGEGELIVGWHHSHPFRLCAECPVPVPAECQAKVLFYSADDLFLMQLTFPRPFMIGLLSSVDPKLEQTLGRSAVKLFGWRNGVVVPRGFTVSDG